MQRLHWRDANNVRAFYHLLFSENSLYLLVRITNHRTYTAWKHPREYRGGPMMSTDCTGLLIFSPDEDRISEQKPVSFSEGGMKVFKNFLAGALRWVITLVFISGLILPQFVR